MSRQHFYNEPETEFMREVRLRTNARFRDYIKQKFKESGISKGELARRIQRNPSSVYAFFQDKDWQEGWQLNTMIALLAAICGEELIPYSVPIGEANTSAKGDWIALSTDVPEGYEKARQTGYGCADVG